MPLLPLARTPRESHLYIALHPCACGEASTGENMRSFLWDFPDGWARKNEFTCPGCGTVRTFVFELPDWPHVEPDAFGADEPSQLIDAGEWLRLAHRWASSVPFEPSPDPKHEKVLKLAISGMDEVLKFFPPDAREDDELPDEAFWTERGRAYRAEQPFGGLRRYRLEAYRSGLVGLAHTPTQTPTPTPTPTRAYRKLKNLWKKGPGRA